MLIDDNCFQGSLCNVDVFNGKKRGETTNVSYGISGTADRLVEGFTSGTLIG